MDSAIKTTYFKHNPHTDRWVCVAKLTNGFELESSPQTSRTLARNQAHAQVKMLFDFHYYCLKTGSFNELPADPTEESEWVVEHWYRSGR